MFTRFTEDDFGKFVTTAMTAESISGNKIKLVGRLVQVRKKAGAFGSDLVLLRHIDDTLTQHSNQDFTLIDDYFLCQWLEFMFKDTSRDSPKEEYTLGEGRRPKTGFIILDDRDDQNHSCSFAITVSKAADHG
ncbi:MAG TPA: hypothetical protein EYN67_14360 [Flavobacteriales bacterium]|nr:hypothetical protein [Flavobacteriales bacterium]